MKPSRRMIALATVAVVMGVSAVSAQLAGRIGDVIESTGPGAAVDWTKGIISATGLGSPPPHAVNPGQARAMAERTAFLVATRNLMELVKGLRVDSATLVENMMVASDMVKTEVSGFVQGATVSNKKVHPDGSVELTIAMKMTGDLLKALMPKTGGGQPLFSPGSAPAGLAFTGLIVDARGTGVRPAMAPKIRNEEGREVYGSAFVNREYAAEQGMVGYLKDPQAAQENSRVTDRPLVVKAIKTDGPNKTDLVISNNDAATLHGVKENLSFLEKARVVVILD